MVGTDEILYKHFARVLLFFIIFISVFILLYNLQISQIKDKEYESKSE